MEAIKVQSAGKKLKTPRAAAIAGIIFAVLYSTCMWLIRSSVPTDQPVSVEWLEQNARSIALALNLVPYAGIAFLWFIGVIRDRIGDAEDLFFSTIFLGSGLLFLAMLFVAAAVVAGYLNSFPLLKVTQSEGGIFNFSRAVVLQVINVYALRMAGVFMLSLGTIWIRSGTMHRGWAVITYSIALVQLLITGSNFWAPFLFPAWVLMVSIYILLLNLRSRSQEMQL